jgi:hypothetical protein
MQLARPISLPKRRHRHLTAVASPPPPPAATNLARERNQRANVSEDTATYSCGCGYVFTAPVSTTVGCPHCGADQAW